MIPKKFIATTAVCLFLIVVLFEISWVQNGADGSAHEIPDPSVETRYENCYAMRDDLMHREAFGTIDNPDVQREFISANRAVIAAECRAEFPQKMIAVEHEDPATSIEFKPRFW